MKLTKENIYISLQGKSEEELTELYELVKGNLWRNIDFRDNPNNEALHYEEDSFIGYKIKYCVGEGKTEVTIEQFKKILQPMKKFEPIAMRCTEEQFEAIKPKLGEMDGVMSFIKYPYLVNNCDNRKNVVTNVKEENKTYSKREVHEQWNEEIFLKACGIEVENLEQKEQRLLKELEEVRQEIEENKPKVGDWCKFWDNGSESNFVIGKLCNYDLEQYFDYYNAYDNAEKITNKDLIRLLCSTRNIK